MSLSLLERVQLKLERPIIFRGHTTMQVFQLLYLINCLVLCDILAVVQLREAVEAAASGR